MEARIAKGEDFTELAQKLFGRPGRQKHGRLHRLPSEGHA